MDMSRLINRLYIFDRRPPPPLLLRSCGLMAVNDTPRAECERINTRLLYEESEGGLNTPRPTHTRQAGMLWAQPGSALEGERGKARFSQ